MEKEELKLIRQKMFKLTQDLVPIHHSGSGLEGAIFICPLPKNYENILGDRELITTESKRIKEEINYKASKSLTPFENILSGYEERTKEEQMKLQHQFKISRVSIDQRGVYGVWAGADVNSGDIYLSNNVSKGYDFIVGEAFKDLFEEKTAFCCHNVDFYWQALLTREFCIEYFNFLNSLIFKDK